jgi:hypothetical protein
MVYRFRIPAVLAALLAVASCECPRGGAHVTITELAALTPSGRLYGVEELRGNPAPTCADLTQAMGAGAALPGELLNTQATDRLDAGELFMVSTGEDDWRGCRDGSASGTFVVWIYDIPADCFSQACAPATPLAVACSEGVSIPAASTRDLILPAVPFP